jgi:V8-like Glu-specific endopeptidase
MRHPVRFPVLALLALLAGLPAPAAAQAGGQGDGNLRSLDVGVVAGRWAAVGRIDFGERGFCTGTLVAPDLVLTAAHCLFDRDNGDRMDLAEMKFLAGWRNGRAEAYRGITAAQPHPDYVFDGVDAVRQAAQVGTDLALLRLDQPILLPSIPPALTGEGPAMGDDVSIVSYAKDRSEAPSIQDVCQVVARQAGMAVLDCPVDFGASGAPVFRETERGMEVVSVISAKAEALGRPIALAAPVAGMVDLLRSRIAGASRATAPGVRVLSGGGAGGAKFLKVDEAP